MEAQRLSKDVESTVSGIALLYGTTEAGWQGDEYTARLYLAMEAGNLDEAKHVSALMVAHMAAEGIDQAEFAAHEWTKTFHPEDLEGR